MQAITAEDIDRACKSMQSVFEQLGYTTPGQGFIIGVNWVLTEIERRKTAEQAKEWQKVLPDDPL